MKTTAYLQLAAKHSPGGRVVGISAKRVSSRCPNHPIAGAFLLKLVIEIPDEVFEPTNVHITVPAELVRRAAAIEAVLPSAD